MRTRLLLFAIASLAWPSAQAATVFFSATTTDMLLSANGGTEAQTLNIQGFDPQLGKLNSISLTLQVDQTTTDVRWVFQNQSGATLTNTFTRAIQSIQLLNGATVVRSNNGTSTYFQTSTAAGASFTLNGVWGSSGSGTSNVSTALRPLFVGAGMIPFTISGTGLTHAESGGLVLTDASGNIHYTVTVSGTYNYTPAPEPATFALSGFALIGVGYLRFRRRP